MMDLRAVITIDARRVLVAQRKPKVFVARCDAEPDPSAWSNAGKARSYIEDRYGDLEWERDGAEWTATDSDGDTVADVTGIEIMDPAALAARYPSYLPGTSYIDDAPPDE
jgi:hypothetical protein